MNSKIEKRSIVILGHKTSVSMEGPFWFRLKQIAAKLGKHLSDLVAEIDEHRDTANLSSAIRLFILEHYVEKVNQYEQQANAPHVARAPSRSSRESVE